MDQLIREAGAWALGQFRLDPVRLAVRPASVQDAPTLNRIEQACFNRATPDAQARAFCKPNASRHLGGGVLLKALVELDGLPVAYLMLELRHGMEVYVFEMAVLSNASQRLGCQPANTLGPMLLAMAARIAQQERVPLVTANLSCGNRSRAGRHQALMLAHCRRHGLTPSGERGFLFDGGRQQPDDIWLAAPWQSIFDSLQAKYFERNRDGTR
jgi:hypothetical protein